MFNWFKEWWVTIRKLQEPNPVTEEMVYAVIPTTWIRKTKVRERLVHQYSELVGIEISDAQIYICIRMLEASGRIECAVRRYPKMHYDVGICRKSGPSRPSAKVETSLKPAHA